MGYRIRLFRPLGIAVFLLGGIACGEGSNPGTEVGGSGGTTNGTGGTSSGEGGTNTGGTSGTPNPVPGSGGCVVNPVVTTCTTDDECFDGLACLKSECPTAPRDQSRYVTWTVRGTSLEEPFSGACRTPSSATSGARLEAVVLGDGSVVIACEHGYGLYDWRLRLQIDAPSVGSFPIAGANDPSAPASLEIGGRELGDEIIHSRAEKQGEVIVEAYVPNERITGHFRAEGSESLLFSGSFSLPITPR
jgi:hypothetical protein